MGGQGFRLAAWEPWVSGPVRVLLVFTLCVLGGWGVFPLIGWGDVTGTLTLETVLHPTQSPSAEAEERVYIVDFRAHLEVGVQTSGLLLQVDSLLGPPGFEHVLLTASGTLGGLDLRALAAFARPYASLSLTSGLTGWINAFPFTVPIGPTLLVTHRVETSLTLFGVLLKNVVLFEDVNFRHPFATLTLPGGGDPLPVLPSYTAQSQAFRFGDIVTVQGQLYNGSTLTLVTGINADPSQGKAIKGHGFSGAVIDSKTLRFVQETLSLQGWRIGRATVGLSATFGAERITTSGSVRYPLPGGTLTLTLTQPPGQDLPIPLVPSSASLVLTRLPLTLTFVLDPLEVRITSVTGSTSLPLSEIASLALQVEAAPGTGLQSLTAALVVNPPEGVQLSGRVNLFPNAPLVGTATMTVSLTPFLSLQGTITVSPGQPQPQVLRAAFSATYRF